jgi:predicted membrane protein
MLDTIKPKLLQLSSLIFLTNVVTAYLNEYYFYSFLFVLLTVTSFIVHYRSNFYTNILDKITILLIFFYGSFVLAVNLTSTKKWLSVFIIVLTFLTCVYLYIYGYFTEKLCFSQDRDIAERYHVFMHTIGSLGHHLLVYL